MGVSAASEISSCSEIADAERFETQMSVLRFMDPEVQPLASPLHGLQHMRVGWSDITDYSLLTGVRTPACSSYSLTLNMGALLNAQAVYKWGLFSSRNSQTDIQMLRARCVLEFRFF